MRVVMNVDRSVPKWVTAPAGSPKELTEEYTVENDGEIHAIVEEARRLAKEFARDYPSVSYFIMVWSDDGLEEYDSLYTHFTKRTNTDVLKRQLRKEFVERFK
mgnify:CR=1 FL=1